MRDTLLDGLEDATEGSRDFDRAIALAFSWARTWSEDRVHGGWYWRGGPSDVSSTEESADYPPSYSTDVSAAMEIAHPPGHHLWTITIRGVRDRNPAYCVWRVEITVPSSEFQGRARTQPLAICAAAVRMIRDQRIASLRSQAP
jgi:hypothetical protein